MGRTLVVGDIHAGLRGLKQALERCDLKENDQVVFLGDYTDAWSEAVETIDFLIDFSNRYESIMIMGNHDQLLRDYFRTGKAHPKWLRHGGQVTLDAYKRKGSAAIEKKHLNFLESLKSYHIDMQNRLFIHGGFTNLNGVSQEWFDKMFYWDRTLWELACAVPEDLSQKAINYPKRFKLYKEIYIGHTPTLRLGVDLPIVKHSIHNLDTGGGFNKGRITIYDADSKEFWQSDLMKDLYPEESGREV
ncbi:MAG: metallophosphoesterase [Flavobacteriaceae bacterium]